jgi:maltooligosyltrehalose trehalohydrolase
VEVVLDGARAVPLHAEPGGYFSGSDENSGAGTQYQFRLDGRRELFPDPASRRQPLGPHGPSQIVDPASFQWSDRDWPGVRLEGQVVYEMHIGTYTREGTWRAALRHLPELKDTGITLLEIMPVADFPGAFGWGYDGVGLFAPKEAYGSPDDFRAFVDYSHRLGLGVILDVVYNHFGPDGNYLREFSEHYFTSRYKNEWGEAINFDGPPSGPVREFFEVNARYWISEFHLDGLRLDATQQIFDASTEHIILRITNAARSAAGRRNIVLIGENEPQNSRLVRPPEQGGYGLDAVWNDDFHHTAHVALTRRNEGYYSDYLGTPQEFISAIKWGFLYQGQHYTWQKKPRGTPVFDVKAAAFVNYIENHDQVANSVTGQRTHQLTSPGRLRAITALLLLGPGTPLLLQGQEFGASTPFLYFADHNETLAPLVQKGRVEFLKQFPSIFESHPCIPAPHERSTFEKCQLNHSEREKNAHIVALHRDLLRLRREDPVFRVQQSDRIQGAVLGDEAFLLRFFGGDYGDRLLLVNLGRDLSLSPIPEPLLAPPDGIQWRTIWSSESPPYLGCGREPLDQKGRWFINGESAAVLSSENGIE